MRKSKNRKNARRNFCLQNMNLFYILEEVRSYQKKTEEKRTKKKKREEQRNYGKQEKKP